MRLWWLWGWCVTDAAREVQLLQEGGEVKYNNCGSWWECCCRLCDLHGVGGHVSMVHWEHGTYHLFFSKHVQLYCICTCVYSIPPIELQSKDLISFLQWALLNSIKWTQRKCWQILELHLLIRLNCYSSDLCIGFQVTKLWLRAYKHSQQAWRRLGFSS
jgi:hypothetical protein